MGCADLSQQEKSLEILIAAQSGSQGFCAASRFPCNVRSAHLVAPNFLCSSKAGRRRGRLRSTQLPSCRSSIIQARAGGWACVASHIPPRLHQSWPQSTRSGMHVCHKATHGKCVRAADHAQHQKERLGSRCGAQGIAMCHRSSRAFFCVTRARCETATQEQLTCPQSMWPFLNTAAEAWQWRRESVTLAA